MMKTNYEFGHRISHVICRGHFHGHDHIHALLHDHVSTVAATMLTTPPPPSPSPPAPATSCSASDKEKVKTCMFNKTSIDACCPTFKSILGTSCPCYKYAEDLDNQVLITLEAYCDVDSPCRGVPSPPPPPPKSSCSASDKEKVKMCMFNTTSIDACCPTFKSILCTSCPCYKYAEDLDNQVLITLEAYCDVDSSCKGVQVIKLSKNDE